MKKTPTKQPASHHHNPHVNISHNQTQHKHNQVEEIQYSPPVEWSIVRGRQSTSTARAIPSTSTPTVVCMSGAKIDNTISWQKRPIRRSIRSVQFSHGNSTNSINSTLKGKGRKKMKDIKATCPVIGITSSAKKKPAWSPNGSIPVYGNTSDGYRLKPSSKIEPPSFSFQLNAHENVELVCSEMSNSNSSVESMPFFKLSKHQPEHKTLENMGSSISAFNLEEKPAQSMDSIEMDFKNSFEGGCSSPLTNTSSFHQEHKTCNDTFSPKEDIVVSCARAVLKDCLREKQSKNRNVLSMLGGDNLKASNNKRNRDDIESGYFPSVSCGIKLNNVSDDHGLSCSSSSDDELSYLSSREPPIFSSDKTNGLSSRTMSPAYVNQDFESHSPYSDISDAFLEESGLPVEVRYMLPLALGTANETKTSCSVCYINYNVGDHIVTLPCHHFFHASCIDKWLWSHTSCPLCRAVVSIDDIDDSPPIPHQFAECTEVDQESTRRRMRTVSCNAGFRPVQSDELEELQSRLDEVNIDERQMSKTLEHLVCPVPQRHVK